MTLILNNRKKGSVIHNEKKMNHFRIPSECSRLVSKKANLAGKRFGRWYVKEFAGRKGTHNQWKCICDCGTERIVASIYLRNGESKSCGCSKYMNPEVMATKSPSSLEIAWTAGIYEGEGCCSPLGWGGTGVSVTQKDPEILIKLKELFGGKISKVKKTNLHRWYINGVRARGFLMTIYKLLSIRRKEQIKKVL